MKRNNGSRGREGGGEGSVTLLITAERDSGKNNARVVRFLIVSPRFMRSFLARALRYNRLMPRNNGVTWLLIIIRCGEGERNVNRVLISLTNRFALLWGGKKKKKRKDQRRSRNEDCVCFECTWRASVKRFPRKRGLVEFEIIRGKRNCSLCERWTEWRYCRILGYIIISVLDARLWKSCFLLFSKRF